MLGEINPMCINSKQPCIFQCMHPYSISFWLRTTFLESVVQMHWCKTASCPASHIAWSSCDIAEMFFPAVKHYLNVYLIFWIFYTIPVVLLSCTMCTESHNLQWQRCSTTQRTLLVDENIRCSNASRLNELNMNGKQWIHKEHPGVIKQSVDIAYGFTLSSPVVLGSVRLIHAVA